MTPVDQKIIDRGSGDCMRASIASLLDLPIDAVPHFILHHKLHQLVFMSFMKSVGWEYLGVMNFERGNNRLSREDSIHGYFRASVPSRNYDGVTHSVVMDMDGVVVHDPNPKKNYQSENIIESEALLYWDLVEPRTDEAWLSWNR